MSFREESEDLKCAIAARQDAGTRGEIARADNVLQSSFVPGRALAAGDLAPDFSLESTPGRVVDLGALLALGPVVVNFFRGEWCDYCALELSALDRIAPQLVARGVSVISIGPLVDRARVLDGTGLAISPRLEDADCTAAKSFGLTYMLPPAFRSLYHRLGYRPSMAVGEAKWLLPLPASYLIAPNGRIALAHVDADYRSRLDPLQILAAVEASL